MSVPVPMYGFGGGGGTSLNFDVKAYATEEALLAATPKENTIGIITTNKITGWMFAAADPAEPVEGMVYITTGTKSDIAFNALKKNGIQVYPLSAKQYVSGALVDVTAMSYQGGEWVSWLPQNYLYYEGYEYDDITGGWDGFVGYVGSSTTYSLGTFTKKEKSIRIANISGAKTTVAAAPKNTIDLTDVNTVVFNLVEVIENVDFFISTVRSNKFEANSVATVKAYAGDKTVSIDVSTLSGSYYIGPSIWGSGGTVYEVEFNEVELRK